MAQYASLEEAFGSSFGKKTANKGTYNSPTRRTEAANEQHAAVITELSKSLPIATHDDDIANNYAPARMNQTTNQREPFTLQAPQMPETRGFAYGSPIPEINEKLGWDRRIDKIVRHLERQNTVDTSTHDLLLYVFTGVFFLFVFDTFVTLGRRSRN
jgi:hypothetical protein